MCVYERERDSVKAPEGDGLVEPHTPEALVELAEVHRPALIHVDPVVKVPDLAAHVILRWV